MLKISKQQMNQFRQAEIEHFVHQMMGHAHRFFSERARKLGDDELRLWIWRGISKAESYGFVTCRDICLFLTLMFTFGCEFDMNDNENAWAKQILRNQFTVEPTALMNQLCTAAIERLRAAH